MSARRSRRRYSSVEIPNVSSIVFSSAPPSRAQRIAKLTNVSERIFTTSIDVSFSLSAPQMAIEGSASQLLPPLVPSQWFRRKRLLQYSSESAIDIRIPYGSVSGSAMATP